MMCGLDDDGDDGDGEGVDGDDDSILLFPSPAANPHANPPVQIPDCFRCPIPCVVVVVVDILLSCCPPLSLP